MNVRDLRRWQRPAVALATLCAVLVAAGCASDGDYGGSSSVSVGVGYSSYYGPGWYGGYYAPYPPVVIVPPEDRPDRPGDGIGGERPSQLPGDGSAVSTLPATRPSGSATRPSTAPSRPATSTRPTSRPSSRPAPRPMPRARPRGR